MTMKKKTMKRPLHQMLTGSLILLGTRLGDSSFALKDQQPQQQQQQQQQRQQRQRRKTYRLDPTSSRTRRGLIKGLDNHQNQRTTTTTNKLGNEENENKVVAFDDKDEWKDEYLRVWGYTRQSSLVIGTAAPKITPARVPTTAAAEATTTTTTNSTSYNNTTTTSSPLSSTSTMSTLQQQTTPSLGDDGGGGHYNYYDSKPGFFTEHESFSLDDHDDSLLLERTVENEHEDQSTTTSGEGNQRPRQPSRSSSSASSHSSKEGDFFTTTSNTVLEHTVSTAQSVSFDDESILVAPFESNNYDNQPGRSTTHHSNSNSRPDDFFTEHANSGGRGSTSSDSDDIGQPATTTPEEPTFNPTTADTPSYHAADSYDSDEGTTTIIIQDNDGDGGGGTTFIIISPGPTFYPTTDVTTDPPIPEDSEEDDEGGLSGTTFVIIGEGDPLGLVHCRVAREVLIGRTAFLVNPTSDISHVPDCVSGFTSADFDTHVRGSWFKVTGTGTRLKAMSCPAFVSIYEGEDCDNLKCTHAKYNSLDCRVEWNTIPGTTYYILVQTSIHWGSDDDDYGDNNDSNEGGFDFDITLQVTDFEAPSYDGTDDLFLADQPYYSISGDEEDNTVIDECKENARPVRVNSQITSNFQFPYNSEDMTPCGNGISPPNKVTLKGAWFKVNGRGDVLRVSSCPFTLSVFDGTSCNDLECAEGRHADSLACEFEWKTPSPDSSSSQELNYILVQNTVAGVVYNGPFELSITKVVVEGPPTTLAPETTTPTLTPPSVTTMVPTFAPTAEPTPGTTLAPTFKPTGPPATPAPSFPPETEIPTFTPTSSPETPATIRPSLPPGIITESPTFIPTTPSPQQQAPTFIIPEPLPTDSPTFMPTSSPESPSPTQEPTVSPQTQTPSVMPSSLPPVTDSPTFSPTPAPSQETRPPTFAPSLSPSTDSPTFVPTSSPETSPPTTAPSSLPPITESPTFNPTESPTFTFTPTAPPQQEQAPTFTIPEVPPTDSPTFLPTTSTETPTPTQNPTQIPSMTPSLPPITDSPTFEPTPVPSVDIPDTIEPTRDVTTTVPTVDNGEDDVVVEECRNNSIPIQPNEQIESKFLFPLSVDFVPCGIEVNQTEEKPITATWFTTVGNGNILRAESCPYQLSVYTGSCESLNCADGVYGDARSCDYQWASPRDGEISYILVQSTISGFPFPDFGELAFTLSVSDEGEAVLPVPTISPTRESETLMPTTVPSADPEVPTIPITTAPSDEVVVPEAPTSIPATTVPSEQTTDIPSKTLAPSGPTSTAIPTVLPTAVPITSSPTIDVPPPDLESITPTLLPTVTTSTSSPTESSITVLPTVLSSTLSPSDTESPSVAISTSTPTDSSTTDLPTFALTTSRPTADPFTELPTVTATTLSPTDAPLTIEPTTTTSTGMPSTESPSALTTTFSPTTDPFTESPTPMPSTTITEAPSQLQTTLSPTIIVVTSAPSQAPTFTATTMIPETSSPTLSVPITTSPTAATPIPTTIALTDAPATARPTVTPGNPSASPTTLGPTVTPGNPSANPTTAAPSAATTTTTFAPTTSGPTVTPGSPSASPTTAAPTVAPTTSGPTVTPGNPSGTPTTQSPTISSAPTYTPPRNNNCPGSLPLDVGETLVTSTLGATPEPGGLDTCFRRDVSDADVTRPGIWYDISIPTSNAVDERMRITACNGTAADIAPVHLTLYESDNNACDVLVCAVTINHLGCALEFDVPLAGRQGTLAEGQGTLAGRQGTLLQYASRQSQPRQITLTYKLLVQQNIPINNPTAGGIFWLSLERASVPSNDDCLGSTFVDVGARISATALSATPEPLQTTALCRRDNGDMMERLAEKDPVPGIWYRMFVGGRIQLLASACSSQRSDLVHVTVYTGACNELECLSDPETSQAACETRWEATSSESVYFILVERVLESGLDDGNYELVVDILPTPSPTISPAPTTFPPPRNDNCPGSLPLIVGETIMTSTQGATPEPRGLDTCFRRDVTDNDVTQPGIWFDISIRTSNAMAERMRINACNGTAADIAPVHLTLYESDNNACDVLVCAVTVNHLGCALDFDVPLTGRQGSFLPDAQRQSGDTQARQITLTYKLLVQQNVPINDPTAGGIFWLSLENALIPPNDDCLRSTFLEAGTRVSETALSATPEPLQTTALCPRDNGDMLERLAKKDPVPGVWYRMFVGGRVGLIASACSSQRSDLVHVTVYSGDCNSLECLSDSETSPIACETVWEATSSESVYFILVERVLESGLDDGNFELFVDIIY